MKNLFIDYSIGIELQDNSFIKSLAKQYESKSLTENQISALNGILGIDEDIIEYKMAGVQEGVYRKLRLGKYPIQSQLDLHRKTMKEARELLYGYILKCHESGWRTVMVLHGKGGVNGKKAQMKSFCAIWLKQMDYVMAYHSAQPKDGGAGALYVLVKKNTANKNKTAELFNR